MVVPTGGCSMSCCSMDTWLSRLVDVHCVAVRWTHGCPYWWINGDGLTVRWYICQAVFCEWSMVKVWFWRWWICQAVFCDWSLEIGQVGISRWRHADTWGSGSLLPWCSIMSGCGHHHLCFWMLISLRRLTLTFCRLTVTLFHFLLRCAVFDSMFTVFYSLCSVIMHIVVLIMLPLLFAWLCWCLFCCVFAGWLLFLILCSFNFLRYFSHLTTLLRFLLQYFVYYARVSLLFWTVVFVVWVRGFGSLCLVVCIVFFYFSTDIFLNELSFSRVVVHLF